jgi:hypothetical protein
MPNVAVNVNVGVRNTAEPPSVDELAILEPKRGGTRLLAFSIELQRALRALWRGDNPVRWAWG